MTNIMLLVKTKSFASKIRKKVSVPTLAAYIQHSTGSLSPSNLARKIIKDIHSGKE